MGNAYDAVMESRKEVIQEMLDLIRSGELNWERGWKAATLSPHNPVSNVVYRGGNRIRLMIDEILHGYEDPRYVTFVQAKEKGWKIKKGEKAKLCEKYIFTKQEEKINEETGKKEKVTVLLERPIIRFFYVFNAAQVEGMPPIPKEIVNQDLSHEDILENLIQCSPCAVEEKMQPHAYYSPGKDIIVMPPRTSFYSNDDFIKTLAHEQTHATGAKTRLNRDLTGAFGSENYAREELRAELGSMFLMSDLGLPGSGKVKENHAAYLQSWLESLKNDPNELFRAAADAEKAADYIKMRYESVVTKLPECEIDHSGENEERDKAAQIEEDKLPASNIQEIQI